jgi:ABC-type polysaccharide/polyol phosphate transport system ATPase subunit
VCERVLWLESGRVKQVGPADEVLEIYSQFHATASE